MKRLKDCFTDDRPHLVGGVWTAGGGEAFDSTSPATGDRVWAAAAAAAARTSPPRFVPPGRRSPNGRTGRWLSASGFWRLVLMRC